jgi:hypothetical protein
MSLAWPSAPLPSADEAALWISRTLPGQPSVEGPLRVEHVKGWGVVARFRVARAETGGQEVIFKASHLPLFTHAPRIDEMLMRCCPGDTPQLLAAQSWGDHVWSLYQPFAGTLVTALKSVDAIGQLAEQFARIQVRVADLPPEATAGIPRSSLADLPAQFDAVLQDVVDKQWAVWQARRMAQHQIPTDLVARLAAFRPRLLAWAAELAAFGWPLTIDHVDLHSDNAVLTPAGRILIFDWEEATLGLPGLSMDRLLDDARALDEERGHVPPHWDGGRYSPAELAVRDAYLRVLPWGSLADRQRAFDLALCLAPIKTTHEGRVFGIAQGWPNGAAGQAAQLLTKACRRWATHA